MPLITAWATLVCGLLCVALTFRVIDARRASGVSLGDGGDEVLLRRMRGQGNANEQIPITLIALLVAEMVSGGGWLLAIFAALFCAGRLAHGIAFGWTLHNQPLRFFGTIASLLGSLAILGYLVVYLFIGSST